jgi:3-methyladenine DNA glycosylase AlkD
LLHRSFSEYSALGQSRHDRQIGVLPTGQIDAMQVRAKLRKLSSRKDAEILRRFFKTGPGEYGEGDVFIGVRVPRIRQLVKEHHDLPMNDVRLLLKSAIHEERLLALLILVRRYAQGSESEQKRVYELYTRNTRYINNWDLIDLTAEHIVGAYLCDRSKAPLLRLARSADLWERRIAVLATFHYIKRGRFNETLKVAGMLLGDDHDLIHKAVGWMLREVGKRDSAVEETFLRKHYRTMPRTMLRYAIEKFPEAKRQKYLQGKI